METSLRGDKKVLEIRKPHSCAIWGYLRLWTKLKLKVEVVLNLCLPPGLARPTSQLRLLARLMQMNVTGLNLFLIKKTPTRQTKL